MTTGASYLRTLPAAKDVVIVRWATYPVKLLANLYQPCRLSIYHVLPIKQHWRMYLLTHAARSGPAAIFRRNCQVNNSSDEKIYIPQHPSQLSGSQLSKMHAIFEMRNIWDEKFLTCHESELNFLPWMLLTLKDIFKKRISAIFYLYKIY